ncbi:MAG: hypothetical protein ACRDY2_10960 [Acidimicrobiales bacterium]
MPRIGPALWGSLRYELLMAARRKVLWLTVVPLALVSLIVGATSPAVAGLHAPAGEVGEWLVFVNELTTLGLVVALADRFARTRRRGLVDLLDATPAGPRLRMVGTLVGGLTAALGPVAVGALCVGGYVALQHRDPFALAWAAGGFLVVVLPAALLMATLAATLGLLVPVPVVRVLLLVGWFWATLFDSRILPLPSITGTVLSPLGDYAAHGWLHAPALWAGHGGIGALSPAASASTAALNVGLLLVATVLIFLVASAVGAARS